MLTIRSDLPAMRSLLRGAKWIAWVVVLGFSIGVVSAQTYTVTDLGLLTDIGAQSQSKPNAINNAGSVAAANVIGGAYRALVYSGSWSNLGTLGGGNSYAAGINDSGRVVGYSLTAGGLDHAFLWTPGGSDGVLGNIQMKDLGTLGGTSSEAYGINQNGEITGFAQTSKNDHAFKYSGGAMTDIGALLGNSLPNSYGYAINNSGHIAGTAYNNSFSVAHAFLYNGVTAQDIGSLGGDANASSINNNDQIAGYSSTSGGFDHAFRYSGGVMTDLGTLGGSYSYANGINNSNVIVGGAFTDSANSIFHAFVCPANSMTDLNASVDASGSGWILVEARAINDAGQIVGVGTFAGNNHGFLLRPTSRIIQQQPTNITVACQGNATFAVKAAPLAASYQWYRGNPPGLAIPNATNSVLNLANVTGTQAGAYYVIVSVAVNSETSAVAMLTVVDSSPPTFTGCPANITKVADTGACTAVVTWTNPTAIDGCDGAVPVTCTPTNGSRFNKGVTTVVCRANDSSGNTNTCAFTVTIVDSSPPAFSGCPANITKTADAGGCTAAVTWTDPIAIDACDGLVPVICTPTNGSRFNKGVTTVICSANDSSGNTNTCAFTVTVIDPSPPILSACPSNITAVADAGTCTAVVNWTNPTAIDGCGGTVPVICTPTNGSRFNRGVTAVICRAIDSSGNSNTCAFTVTVLDSEPPVFAGCPINQTNYVLHDASTATATWITPSAVDNCDGVVPVICTPQSGSMFVEGVTTVICSANDSSGNSNSCSFTITVVKAQDPEITDFKLIGNDVVISFTSIAAGQYSMQAIANPVGGWTDVLTGIPGRNGILTVTNFGGATFPPRFFRIKQSLP